MASTAGRFTRGVIGIALISRVFSLAVSPDGWGLRGRNVGGGLFDFCVITGLIDSIWSGREVRAWSPRSAATCRRRVDVKKMIGNRGGVGCRLLLSDVSDRR